MGLDKGVYEWKVYGVRIRILAGDTDDSNIEVV